jgi:uncharacterized protein YaaR (DUF327 family)
MRSVSGNSRAKQHSPEVELWDRSRLLNELRHQGSQNSEGLTSEMIALDKVASKIKSASQGKFSYLDVVNSMESIEKELVNLLRIARPGESLKEAKSGNWIKRYKRKTKSYWRKRY